MFGRRATYAQHPTADRRTGAPQHIVGESFHQDILKWAQTMEREHGAQFDVALVPEPRNPHDRRAIRVDLLTGSGPRPVGHIARGETDEWHDILQDAPRGVIYTWPAETTGGGPYSIGLVFLARF